MTARKPAFIAVDGMDGAAIVAAARTALASIDREVRGGISHWDASGLFGEAAVAGDEAGQPSARTLLLIYAADLAFRLRWEIRPAIAEGRGVVAAPYVDTAVAFGRAAGIEPGWLANLFQFAPRPNQRQFADEAARSRRGHGFVQFALECAREVAGETRTGLAARMAVHLRASARRRGSPG